jgi:hypothetical protein
MNIVFAVQAIVMSIKKLLQGRLTLVSWCFFNFLSIHPTLISHDHHPFLSWHVHVIQTRRTRGARGLIRWQPKKAFTGMADRGQLVLSEILYSNGFINIEENGILARELLARFTG